MLAHRQVARLLIAGSLLVAGCGGGGGGDSSGSCTEPITLDVTLNATTIAIGGATTYTAVIHNPCSTAQTGLLLQGLALQGSASRAAGGSILLCGEGIEDGTAPPGDCAMAGMNFVASNANSGTGLLTAGAAVARVELRQGNAIAHADTTITLTE